MKALACDMGGTRIKLGVLSDGKILAHDAIDACSEQGLGARLPAITTALRTLCTRAGIEVSECAGIGVSFPSILDPGTGRILDEYGKYKDAPQIDLRRWAQDDLGLPLAIDNDARMALLGEWKHGAGRGSNDVAMVTLGTGIGVAALMDGHLLRGKHGQAAILCGHLTVRYGGTHCHCGNIGCAEAEASTLFLAELARNREDFTRSALKNEPVMDYAAVFRHASAGDSCAMAIRDHSLGVWSSTVVNLIHAFDPEIVVLGGGIMQSAEVILPVVREYADRHAHTPWGKVRIAASELGGNAALMAAEWLLREQLNLTD